MRLESGTRKIGVSRHQAIKARQKDKNILGLKTKNNDRALTRKKSFTGQQNHS